MLHLQIAVQFHQQHPITGHGERPPFKIRGKAVAATPVAVGLEKIKSIRLIGLNQLKQGLPARLSVFYGCFQAPKSVQYPEHIYNYYYSGLSQILLTSS